MNTDSYTGIAKIFHWLLALFLTGMVIVGFYMVSIAKTPESAWYFNMHKSFGLIVGILVILRILWRLTHTPAPLPSTVPLWQANIARTIHFLLYVGMFLMPLTGFLGSLFGKYGIIFFNWQFSWVEKNANLAGQFFEAHKIIVWALLALVTLHVLAALKHLFINKDGVFQRMWF